MANNVYIGNRYVPVFANPVEWDSLRSYEALTIVTYFGTSYTSRKAVPAGIQLSNTEYWVVTGNFNAQVQQLSNDVDALSGGVDALSGRVTTLESDVDTLSGKVTTLESDVDALSGRVTTLESDVDTIDNNLSLIINRKIIFLSDSYATYLDGSNRDFVEIAGDILGMTKNTDYWDFHQSGVGFSNDAPHQFLALLQANESVISNKSIITDIIVSGSANDQLSTYGGIRTGISAFMTYVKANYPNAKVTIDCLSKSIETGALISKLNIVYSAYQSAVEYGCSYAYNSEFVMTWYSRFRGDQLHPTTTALPMLANALVDIVKNGICNVHRYLQGNDLFDFSTSNFLALRNMSQPQVFMQQDNGVVTVTGSQRGLIAYLTWKNAKTIAQGTTLLASSFKLVDSIFYPLQSQQTNWCGLFWYNNVKYYCILTFVSDDIATNDILVDITIENEGASFDIPQGANIALTFSQPLTVVM